MNLHNNKCFKEIRLQNSIHRRMAATVNVIKYGQMTKIGEGLTSIVYKAIDQHNRLICIKVVQPTFYKTLMGKTLIENQIKVLQKLQHKNILKFYSKQEHKSNIALLSQYCEGGDLSKSIKSRLDMPKVTTIIQSIVRGCLYMHEIGYLHRDLKPQNIFITKDTVKIADFGFAVHKDDKNLLKINAGSPLYMAPQVLQKLDFSPKSDVFSVGIIWYELATGRTPWTAKSQKQLLASVLTTKPNMVSIPYPQQIKNIIAKCLHKDKHMRPTFKQIDQSINKILPSKCIVEEKIINQRKQMPINKGNENIVKDNIKLNSVNQQFKITKNSKSKEMKVTKDNARKTDRDSRSYMKEESNVSCKKLKKSIKLQTDDRDKQNIHDRNTFRENKKQQISSKTISLSTKITKNIQKQNEASNIQKRNKNKSFYQGQKKPKNNLIADNININKKQLAEAYLNNKKETNCKLQAPIDFINTLKKVGQEDKFSFLPIFLKRRLTNITQKYKSLILNCKFFATEQAMTDSFICQVSSCKNEVDLCKTTFGFFRRLLRLTKTYTGFQQMIAALNVVLHRIQKRL